MKNYFDPNPAHVWEGVPFVGYFEFCQYGTTEPQPVYDVDGNDLGNVVYTATDGRMEYEVYLEGDYSVRWWLYVGTNADMSQDSDPENFRLVYTQSIMAGGGGDSGELETPKVGSVAELRAIEGMEDGACVLVTGYYKDGDCPARFYLWDASCVQSEDSGYIVQSDSESVGRWIMLWPSAVIPCECYGVIPSEGKTANLPNLLSFPDSVGTSGLRTARTIRFQPGTYYSGSFATTKKVSIPAGFEYSGVIECASVEVDPGASAVCQGFKVTDNGCFVDADWVTDASTLNWSTNNICAVLRSYSITFLKNVVCGALNAGTTILNSLRVTGASILGSLSAGATEVDTLQVKGNTTVGDGNTTGTLTVQALIDLIVNGAETHNGAASFLSSLTATGLSRIKQLELQVQGAATWYPVYSFIRRNWKISLENDRFCLCPVVETLDKVAIEFPQTPNASWSVSLYDSFGGNPLVTWSGDDVSTLPDEATYDSEAHILKIEFTGADYRPRFVKIVILANNGLMTCSFEPRYNKE